MPPRDAAEAAPTPAAPTTPRPCRTAIENYPDASDWPWRYAHAASIEGAHWDIHTATGDINRDHFIGMVEYEANAKAIVDEHNAGLARSTPAEALDPLMPDSEVAEMLRKVIRQYHGTAHGGGSWLNCDDRWCADARGVLGQ